MVLFLKMEKYNRFFPIVLVPAGKKDSSRFIWSRMSCPFTCLDWTNLKKTDVMLEEEEEEKEEKKEFEEVEREEREIVGGRLKTRKL